mmetsp:Transcript_103834/g.294155  ORF Transcript_103834/g.294155 Transcript_103834/m.294155 type:complete len:194 (-) Transcript_103834:229-810(-)
MGRNKSRRRDEGKRPKSKADKGRQPKAKKDKDKDRRHGKRRRSPSPEESEGEYSYTYYSYSESRSPSPERDRGRHRSRSRRRDRSHRRCGDYSPPRRRDRDDVNPPRLGGGGYIPSGGPRSPSRDGSPSNNQIFNMLVDREKARIKRDFAGADKIRDDLRLRGVDILERERRWQHKDGRSGARPNADDKKRDE